MNLCAIAVCVVSQVLDAAPSPTPRTAPPVFFEWVKLDGSVSIASVESLHEGKVFAQDPRGAKLTLSLSEIASVWRVSSTHAFAEGRNRPVPVQVPPSDDGTTLPVPRREWNVELTDSQQFIGELSSDGATADALALKLSSSLSMQNKGPADKALLALPLDRIRRMWANSDSLQRTVVDAGRDVIRLVNGDVLTGFVSSVGTNISIETAPASGTNPAKVQELHQEAVSAIAFTNPLVASKGMLAAFDDGSVMNLANLSIADGQADVVLTLNPQAKLHPPAATIRWLFPQAERWRSLAPDAAGPSSAIESNSSGILLKEPSTFSWPVRPGESIFVAQCTLPPSCFDWGDFTLIVKLVGTSNTREVARLHFDADTPEHRVAIPLKGATAMEWTIDPGASGPVQDRIHISRAGFISAPAN